MTRRADTWKMEKVNKANGNNPSKVMMHQKSKTVYGRVIHCVKLL